jgi:hypothetical protein
MPRGTIPLRGRDSFSRLLNDAVMEQSLSSNRSGGSTSEAIRDLVEIREELRKQLGMESDPLKLSRYYNLYREIQTYLAEFRAINSSSSEIAQFPRAYFLLQLAGGSTPFSERDVEIPNSDSRSSGTSM